MITQNWLQPSDSVLEIYPVICNSYKRKKDLLITAYPVLNSDGKWSVMLINKDQHRTWNIDVEVENTISKQITSLHFTHLIQYSKQQYQWLDNGFNSYASKVLPPVTRKITGSKNISLPPYSLTVVY
jgi:hypothetical protein